MNRIIGSVFALLVLNSSLAQEVPSTELPPPWEMHIGVQPVSPEQARQDIKAKRDAREARKARNATKRAERLRRYRERQRSVSPAGDRDERAQPPRSGADVQGNLIDRVIEWLIPSATAAPTFVGGIDSPSDAEITELARALKNDPDLIFKYVHDNIAVEFTFGEKKGALGALLDQSGNAFDQAALLRELLAAAGYTATFEYGKVSIPQADATSLTGFSALADAGALLVIGGNWDVSTSGNNLLFMHVWVKATINGNDYALDPYIKSHNDVSGIDLGTATGFSDSTFLADATSGSSAGTHYREDFSKANIESNLETYASDLVDEIKTNHPNKTLDEIIGGRVIAPHDGDPTTSATHPNATGTVTNWGTDIDSAYHTTLQIDVLEIDITYRTKEIYGRRLTLGFGTSNVIELRLDGTLEDVSTTSASGTETVEFSITHPYPSTLSALDVVAKPQTLTVPTSGQTMLYSIVNSWGLVRNKGVVDKRQRWLQEYQAAGDADTDETLLGETVGLIGMNWVAQIDRLTQIIAVITELPSIQHHRVGLAGQALSPYVDLPFSQSTAHKPSLTLDELSGGFFTRGGFLSGLEHGVIEQTQPSFKAVSTVRLLTTANDNGERIYLLTPSNSSTISSTLVAGGYTQAELDALTNAGYSVLLPENRSITVDSWTGSAKLAFKETTGGGTTTLSGSYLIGGNLSGGFAAKKGNASVVEIKRHNPIRSIFQWGTKVADPIELQRGSFLLEADDIAVGNGVLPRALGFQRSYSSISNQAGGALGYGWRHNFDITASETSSAEQGMGADSPIDAASIIAGAYVLYEFLQVARSRDRMMIAAIAQNWLTDQLTTNVVDINVPGNTQRFVKLADGTFHPPPGSADALTVETDGSFTLTQKQGVEIDFDTDGKVERWEDPNGNHLTFAYGGDEFLDSVSNSFGRTLTLSYDSNNRIASVSDGNGRSVSYNYDTEGDLVEFTNTLGGLTAYEYDSDHRMLRYYTPEYPKNGQGSNAMVRNTYDSLGRMKEQLNAHGEKWQFYVSGTRGEEVDPLGNSKIFTFSDSGKELSRTDGAGRTLTMSYDAHDRMEEQVFPDGNAVEYEFDAYHNITQVTLKPKPSSSEPDIVTSTEYDLTYHQPKKVTDARGNVTDFTYFSGTPNLQKIEQPLVNGSRPTTTFTYTATGQVATATDPEGQITKFEYDATTDELVKTIVDEGTGRLNITTEQSYDAIGNVDSQTGPRGYVTTFDYDSERRVIRTTAPAPFADYISEVVYDANGRVVETRVATDEPTAPYQVSRTIWTRSDKVDKAIDTAGNATAHTYDSADRLASVVDAAGRETQWTYYGDGQVHQIKQVDNSTPVVVRTNTYTSEGKLDVVTDGEGNDIDYDYDDFSRPYKTTYEGGKYESIEYDAASNVVETRSRAGDITSYTYDVLNRETLKDAPVGSDDIATTYDAVGRVDLVTVNGTDVFNHDYDTAGRVKKITRPDGKVVEYAYDAAGNRTSLKYPGGTYEITYEYDELGRPTKVKENGTDLATYSYPTRLETSVTYNATNSVSTWESSLSGDLSNLTHTLNGETPTFDLYYNATGQVINRVVSPSTYVWNPSTNGTDTYVPNTLNQYGTVNSVTFSHDDNGNLTSDGVDTYGYDYENRLTSATVSSVTTTYAYDAFGRRATKTVGSATTEKFVYDGAEVIEEYAQGSPDTLTARYVYGPGLDQPIYMERGGSRYYYHFDPQGSVTALTNSSGTVVERYSYSPFGEATATSAVGNPYLYTGRRLDAETGLYHYRARAYSPFLGRFLQTDPIGIADGLNLYAYVGNDPLNFADPSGLAARELGSQGLTLFNDAITHPTFVNSVAAIGDTFSGGLTRAYRESRNIGSVDTSSQSYTVSTTITSVVDAVNPKGLVTAGVRAVARGFAKAGQNAVDKSWKGIIEGTAQKTGTPGHQFRSYREAIKMAKSGQYEKVRLNRAYSTTSGVTTSPRRLPDVIGVRKNGRIDAVEVPSKTDNPIALYQRNADAMRQLPQAMRGNVRVESIR